MPSTLGYWNTRGIGQPIRFFLYFVGEEFENVLFELGDGPEFSKAEWYKVKDTLNLEFPNLPFYIDGNVRISQSNTIMRYLGKKYDLLGKTEEERIRCDIMMENAMDFRMKSIYVSYNDNYEKLKGEYFSSYLPTTLAMYEKALSNKPWFAGKEITICDFVMYELLDQHRLLDTSCLKNCPNIREYLSRFESLPRNKEFMQSPMYMKHPIHNKNAHFR